MDWPTFSLLPFNSLNKGARINGTYQMEFVSSKNKGPVILCTLSAHHTQILTLRSYKGTSWTALELSFYQYLLLWLCMFVLNVNHISSKKNTSFHMLFLSSIEPAIQSFSTICILLFYMALSTQAIFTELSVTFFNDTYTGKVLLMNSLFKCIHFTNTVTPSTWGPHVMEDD